MSKVPNFEGIPFSVAGGSADNPATEEKPPPNRRRRFRKAKDKTGSQPPSRFSLRMSAGWWRSLEYIGMSLHFAASPRPPNPDFVRTIPSIIAGQKGEFKLHFYTPKHYDRAKDKGTRFPVVINFHGGGFTIGNATDDARFGRVVVEECHAVFISVEYRLAPEYPFPTPVEDGADAILWVIKNAEELQIDPMNIATSGFSAGGNIAMTGPLRLAAYLKDNDQNGPDAEEIPSHRIVATATWYPITDYTLTRAERRATAECAKEYLLPPMLTDIFDASYLYPPELDLANPYLSPSKASDEILQGGIPPHVLFYTCEWDMLLREGEDLAKRLAAEPISKDLYYHMIPQVPHGWDKGPSPLKPPERAEDLYRGCCERLREIFASD